MKLYKKHASYEPSQMPKSVTILGNGTYSGDAGFQIHPQTYFLCNTLVFCVG